MKMARLEAGFTNQIISLISGIIITCKQNKKILIANDFRINFNKDDVIALSKVVDLQKLNIFLKKYDVLVIDKRNITFNVISIYYGSSEKNKVDITNDISRSSNKLVIKTDLNLNLLKGDPHFGKFKKIYVKFSINSIIFEESFEEHDNYLKKEINYDFDNLVANINNWYWITEFDHKMFDDILVNICYNNCYHDIANKFIKNINNKINVLLNNKINVLLNNKINVLHLRLEDDAIIHWSKKNHLTINDFRLVLENKYINIVSKYIDKNNLNIILSYSKNNKVIDFLKDNNYNYCFIPKDESLGRELNALNDLLVSGSCNNIFVGNFNMIKYSGSTFSYYIIKRLSKAVQKILIDLDKIEADASIIY